MANPLSVQRQAYDFVKDEKAMRLHDSKGSKKNRLYLADYNGVQGGAKVAVAAEIAIPKKGKTLPELGLKDRQFYFLHAVKEGENTTYYKINKSSFLKRTGIKGKDIKIDKDGKLDITTTISQKIDAFTKKLKTLLDKVLMLGDNHRRLEIFEKQFLNCLASDPINYMYSNIFFYNTNLANKQNFFDYNAVVIDPNEPEDPSKSLVIIRYDQDSADPCHTKEESHPPTSELKGEDILFRIDGIDKLINRPGNSTGSMILVTVTKKEYDDIMAGKPISSRLRKALEAR